jgi:NitT/TauT family transport system permease protein
LVLPAAFEWEVFFLKRTTKYLAQITVILIPLAIWELVTRLRLANPFFIPPLFEVAKAMWKLMISGILPAQAVVSIQRALGGFAAAIVLGIPLGVLIGSWAKHCNLVLEPVMEVLSQINPFILFHIIILFLGTGENIKIIVIAWTCIWPIMYSTISGIHHIDPLIIKSARGFGIARWKLLAKVAMPAAGPAIFTGLRISAGYSFFMLIAAEMMGCTSGLGWFILRSQENYRVPDIFAAAIVIALLGLGLDLLIQWIGRRLKVSGDNHWPNILAARIKK